MGKKICVICKKEINTKQKYVLLGTYEGKKIHEEGYFHFDCFRQWVNSKAQEKAENMINCAKEKAMNMLGGLIRQ